MRGTKGIEATGRQIGRELAPGDAPTGAEAFETSLTALGFQPTSTLATATGSRSA